MSIREINKPVYCIKIVIAESIFFTRDMKGIFNRIY